MKRIAALALMTVLGVMAVFAGGKGEAKAVDPNAPVTLTVWCWDPNFNIYAMKEAEKIYQKDHPNFKLNVVETPWEDLQQKLITSFSARQTANLPDIVLMQDNAAQKFITTYPGSFLAVSGQVDLSQFAQFKVDVATVNNKNYAVPFDNGATGTFLRRDIVEQAGLKVADFNDITWERFIELGKTVKAKTGKAMVSAVANQTDFITIMLQGAGTWFFDAQGKTAIKNNAVLKKAVELYLEMVKAGIILEVADWNAYIATLNNGTVAATVNGCWIVGSISAESSQAGKWAVVNTPKFSSVPAAVNYSSCGGSSWMVLASSKNPAAAADFLNNTFAGSVELYETILPSSGAIATWLPAGKSAVYAQPNTFFGGQKIYEDIVGFAGKVPKVKYGVFNYEARDAVARAIADIATGTSIDAALESAQKNLDFLMGQ